MAKILESHDEVTTFVEAHIAGREVLERGPLAVSVAIDGPARSVDIELSTGVRVVVPVRLIQGLGEATLEELRDVEIWVSGLILNWEALDVQLHVPSLVNGVFGTRKWMSELGRAGGMSTSPAKARAARENGKKGGRPRRKVSGA